MAERLLANASVGEIRDLIVTEAATVGPDAEIVDALRKMLDDLRTRHVYVVDERGVLIGSLRLNAVTAYLFPYTSASDVDTIPPTGRMLAAISARKVGDIMNVSPRYVRDGHLVPEVVRIMCEEGINELPVVDGERRVVGEVSFLEIVAAYLKELERSGRAGDAG